MDELVKFLPAAIGILTTILVWAVLCLRERRKRR